MYILVWECKFINSTINFRGKKLKINIEQEKKKGKEKLSTCTVALFQNRCSTDWHYSVADFLV